MNNRTYFICINGESTKYVFFLSINYKKMKKKQIRKNRLDFICWQKKNVIARAKKKEQKHGIITFEGESESC